MKKRSLQGQVGLVTGGGRGIGKAVALALASRGVRVVVTGRSEKALGDTVGEIVAGGGGARHVAGDVRDSAHLDAAVEKAIECFGRLDIVVANAGQSGRVALDDGESAASSARRLEQADAILQTNLMGTYRTFHAAIPRMKGPGRLLSMSSVLAKFGVPGYAAYCASKAGLLGLVRATAHEVAPKGITCNAIVPGWVDTDMADAGLREIGASTGRSPEEVKRGAVAAFPLGRFLEAEEVAELVVFLSSSAADGITGQALSICGGATAFGG